MWLRTGRRYFDVVGARVMAGRTFSADDWRRPGEYVVVNERFARMYLSEGAAVGSRIRLADPAAREQAADAPQWATVVGVVGNIRQLMLPGREFDPVVYSPYTVDPPQMAQVIVRRPSQPAAAVAAIADHVRVLDRDLPLFGAGTIDEILARGTWPQRLFGSMFAVFAAKRSAWGTIIGVGLGMLFAPRPGHGHARGSSIGGGRPRRWRVRRCP